MTMLISDNVGILRAICNVRGSIYQEALTILFVQQQQFFKSVSYYQKKLVELKGERYKSTIIFGVFNTLLLIIGKKNKIKNQYVGWYIW